MSLSQKEQERLKHELGLEQATLQAELEEVVEGEEAVTPLEVNLPCWGQCIWTMKMDNDEDEEFFV